MSILEEKDTLVILPTGFGKSLCYQLPAMLLPGTCIVVSPLISLMTDQVNQLIHKKIPSTYINSSLSKQEKNKRLTKLKKNQYKLVYISSEKLLQPNFIKLCQQIQIPLLVIDEAHCISQWGHNFRIAYSLIPKFINALTQKPTVTAFTATATNKTISDIKKQLQLSKVNIFRKSPLRKNIILTRYQAKTNNEKYLRLIEILKKHYRSCGIIYVSTRKKVLNLKKLLIKFRINKLYSKIHYYHGGMESIKRSRIQHSYLQSDESLIIATNAFGMGINKSNISFIIHYTPPNTLEQYCQEIGRAGRDNKIAYAYLLIYKHDFAINYSLAKKNLLKSSNNSYCKNIINKFESMARFTQTKNCLQKTLNQYFNQSHSPSCNQCSNCQKTSESYNFKRMEERLKAYRRILTNGNYQLSHYIPGQIIHPLTSHSLNTYDIIS